MAPTGWSLRADAPLSFLRTLRGKGRCKPEPLDTDTLRLLHPTVALASSPASARGNASKANRGLPCRHGEEPPLRVLFHPYGEAARLALSGRMADVCTELNRITQN